MILLRYAVVCFFRDYCTVRILYECLEQEESLSCQ